jgi:hypothetical protein
MAKLKALVKSLDDVEEKYRDLYEKTADDRFVLSGVEDTEYKEKLDEFRSNNRELNTLTEQQRAKLNLLKDIDPEQYEKAIADQEELRKLKEKDLIDDGDVEKVVEQRTATMRADHEKALGVAQGTIKELQDENTKIKTKLGDTTIDRMVETSVAKVGNVKKGAWDDVKARGRETWKIDKEGTARPHDATGSPLYGKNGKEITSDEWAQRLVENAPHLFEPAKGGGSSGGDEVDTGKPPGGMVNTEDTVGFGKNLEAIAKGEVKAVHGTS